jgi:hypothetical protein
VDQQPCAYKELETPGWIQVDHSDNIKNLVSKKLRDFEADAVEASSISADFTWDDNVAKKTIVTGTGRCGTSFFMKLLSELGFDTGFDASEPSVKPGSGDYTGFEWRIRGRYAVDKQPAIIKNPNLCRDLLERVERWDWKIDHVYILMRDYDDVANHLWNRRHEGRAEDTEKEGKLKEYKEIAARDIGNLMYQLVSEGIPHTFLLFPKIITDPKYLWLTCNLLRGVPYETFEAAFNKVADVNLVHWGLDKEKDYGKTVQRTKRSASQGQTKREQARKSSKA